MFDINCVNDIIKKLMNEKLFVSEADLQVSFAMKIDQNKYDILPEFPDNGFYYDRDGKKQPCKSEFDLLIIDKLTNEKTIIEFKYKQYNDNQDSLMFNIGNTNVFYILKNHLAHDLGRYDIWSDISRTEHFVNSEKADSGFVIFVTNDEKYWLDNDNNRSPGLEFKYTFSVCDYKHYSLNNWNNHNPYPINGRNYTKNISNINYMYILDAYRSKIKSCGLDRFNKIIDISNEYVFDYKQYSNTKAIYSQSSNINSFKYAIISIKKNSNTITYPDKIDISETNGIFKVKE